MKVKIDKEKCINCGMCVEIAPLVFESIEGESTVRTEVDFTNKEVQDQTSEAVASCPVGAIEIE